MAKATTVEKKKTALLEIPLADPLAHGYCQRHINAHLNHDQAVMLRRIVDGLDASGATLESGRRVVSASAAVMWLIEQVKA